MTASCLVLLAFAAAQVENTVACPSADAVEAELRRLVGDAPTGDLRAAIVEEAGHVVVTITRQGGVILARHELDSRTPCSTRALTVAALIAAWTSDLPGTLVPAPAAL